MLRVETGATTPATSYTFSGAFSSNQQHCMELVYRPDSRKTELMNLLPHPTLVPDAYSVQVQVKVI
jgi:hypothetical protein